MSPATPGTRLPSAGTIVPPRFSIQARQCGHQLRWGDQLHALAVRLRIRGDLVHQRRPCGCDARIDEDDEPVPVAGLLSVVLFGLVLRRGPSPVLGWGAVVVGTVGTAAAIAAATDLPSELVAVSILGTLAFHLVAGLRWLRLARR